MRSLVVTTPATDITLLTIDELRILAEVKNGSRDTELRNLEKRIAASITSHCNVAIGSGAEPTLRRETLTETIYGPCGPELHLARRHNVVVDSATLDGSLVSPSEYFVDAESGMLARIQGGYSLRWYGQTGIVVYSAGFETVPGDLKQAAMDYFRAVLLEGGRDPYAKSVSRDVPGVGSKTIDYWVGSIPGQTNEGAVPDIVAGQLKRFRNSVVG